MGLAEFNKCVGEIMGVKGEVKFAHVVRSIETGEWRVDISITAKPAQIKKLKEVCFPNDSL